MPGCSTPPISPPQGWLERARASLSRSRKPIPRWRWKGRYRIEGPAFVYSDEDTGRVATILGYPTDKLTQAV
jgi:hypothetical protein